MISAGLVTGALASIDPFEEPLFDDNIPVVFKSPDPKTDLVQAYCENFNQYSTTEALEKQNESRTSESDPATSLTEILNDVESSSFFELNDVSSLGDKSRAEPVVTQVSRESSRWDQFETSDWSSSGDTDSEGSLNHVPGIPITVINPDVDSGRALKQSLKDKIRLRRESEGAGDIPVDELFEAPRQYPLTEEEEKRNEIRKARNRRSATKSRLKRIAREKMLEEEHELEEEKNSELQKEIKTLHSFKAILLKKLKLHVKSGDCQLGRTINIGAHSENIQKRKAVVAADEPTSKRIPPPPAYSSSVAFTSVKIDNEPVHSMQSANDFTSPLTCGAGLSHTGSAQDCSQPLITETPLLVGSPTGSNDEDGLQSPLRELNGYNLGNRNQRVLSKEEEIDIIKAGLLDGFQCQS